MVCRGFLLGIQILADDVTPQSLDRFTLSQILWSHLGPNICMGVVNGHWPLGHSHQAPKFLRTLQLLNCQIDSVHFKFYGTALAHRCETIWSLAHQACLSIPVGHTNFCPGRNSRSVGPINSISSSMELSWSTSFWWFAFLNKGIGGGLRKFV